MVKGIDRYSDKDKRKMRRHNHIARDLRTPKYKMRVKEGKPKAPPPEIDEWSLDDDNE